MGAAPLVILLVGMVFPIAVLILAIIVDSIVALWLIYRLWHDEWSVSLRRAVRPHAHLPRLHWPLVRNH